MPPIQAFRPAQCKHFLSAPILLTEQLWHTCFPQPVQALFPPSISTSIIISTSIASAPASTEALSDALQSSQLVAWKKLSIGGVVDGVFVDEEELLDGEDWRNDDGIAQKE